MLKTAPSNCLVVEVSWKQGWDGSVEKITDYLRIEQVHDPDYE
jgi:hypothetical protein